MLDGNGAAVLGIAAFIIIMCVVTYFAAREEIELESIEANESKRGSDSESGKD
jgi:hypothetical protein